MINEGEVSSKKKPHAVFASVNKRKENLGSDPALPCPTAYNMADHKSISKKPLQGGAPNNVLSLQKAEKKKMIDHMFPFIVKNRLDDDSRTIEMSNLGPGSYSPQNAAFLDQNSSVRLVSNASKTSREAAAYVDQESKKVIDMTSAQKANCFGSSQARFDEFDRLLNKKSKMGPGAYSKVMKDPKGKNFSTRFVGQQL